MFLLERGAHAVRPRHWYKENYAIVAWFSKMFCMKKITGKFNEAYIFADVVDENAEAQIQAMCDFEAFAGSRIRIMPDVHAGVGCTIGTTMTICGAVVPDMVGVDIGCGMLTTKLKERELGFAALDEFIRSNIPAGMTARKTPHTMAQSTHIEKLICRDSVNLELARRSVGTLGGGNHFIEVDRDEEGALYLVIHSGSRHIGLEVAEFYQELAFNGMRAWRERQVTETIKRLKAEGRQTEIAAEMSRVRAMFDVPREMSYLTGTEMENYLHDMKIMQEYAEVNRRAMAADILGAMGLTAVDQFVTVHNYIDTEDMILRKGAVSARKGERLLIPINMRDGSLICEGKGNADWNFSAPHGAGRLLSRGEARKKLTVEEFVAQMEGIYTTSVGADTLDENPMAYKNMEDIVGNIVPTAEIKKRILPVYNFKAGGGLHPRLKNKN